MSYVIIDLETTGLKPTRDEIIEMSAIRITGGKPERKAFDKFVKPKAGYVPPEIETLTGIKTDMVKDAGTLDEVLPEFLEFIKDDPVVGWNVNFDVGFIEHNLPNPLPNEVHDLIPDIKEVLPDLPNYKLTTVASHLGMNTSNAHRAIADCLFVYKIIHNLSNSL